MIIAGLLDLYRLFETHPSKGCCALVVEHGEYLWIVRYEPTDGFMYARGPATTLFPAACLEFPLTLLAWGNDLVAAVEERLAVVP